MQRVTESATPTRAERSKVYPLIQKYRTIHTNTDCTVNLTLQYGRFRRCFLFFLSFPLFPSFPPHPHSEGGKAVYQNYPFNPLTILRITRHGSPTGNNSTTVARSITSHHHQTLNPARKRQKKRKKGRKPKPYFLLVCFLTCQLAS